MLCRKQSCASIDIDGKLVNTYQHPPEFKIEPEFVELSTDVITEEIKNCWEVPHYHDKVLKQDLD